MGYCYFHGNTRIFSLGYLNIPVPLSEWWQTPFLALWSGLCGWHAGIGAPFIPGRCPLILAGFSIRPALPPMLLHAVQRSSAAADKDRFWQRSASPESSPIRFHPTFGFGQFTVGNDKYFLLEGPTIASSRSEIFGIGLNPIGRGAMQTSVQFQCLI